MFKVFIGSVGLNVALQPRRARSLGLSQDDTRAGGCKRLLGRSHVDPQERVAGAPLRRPILRVPQNQTRLTLRITKDPRTPGSRAAESL